MGYVLAFIIGFMAALGLVLISDKASSDFYRILNDGEKACENNGGLKSFDMLFTYSCNDGAEIYVPADKVEKQ